MEVLKQAAEQFGLDNTVYYLFLMIAAFYFVFERVYLKPFQNLLDKRRYQTEGVAIEAKEMLARAEEKVANYKKRMSLASEEARAICYKSEEGARKQEAEILAEASQRSKRAVQDTQREIQLQERSILNDMMAETSKLGEAIAEKVLGRTIRTK